jgi:acetyltransferase-like isoleucine patch superfamily enzyme
MQAVDMIFDKILRGLIGALLTDKAQGMIEARIQQLKTKALGRFRSAGPNCHIQYPWNCITGVDRISLGRNFHANKGLFLGAYGEDTGEAQITIGDNVVINYDSQITAISKVVIGDDVLTGSRIFISDHSHGEISAEALVDPPIHRKLFSKGPVIIGNRVWIGSGVAIMPNVSVGDDCIIGANSVVTRSFPARAVIAGNPAKLIRIL